MNKYEEALDFLVMSEILKAILPIDLIEYITGCVPEQSTIKWIYKYKDLLNEKWLIPNLAIIHIYKKTGTLKNEQYFYKTLLSFKKKQIYNKNCMASYILNI